MLGLGVKASESSEKWLWANFCKFTIQRLLMCTSKQDCLIEDLQPKIARGDQTAFKQVFQLFQKKLTLFSKSIVKSEEAAREIVDDVFIKIWRNRSNIMAIANLRLYLYKAAKNSSLNYLSSKANRYVNEPFDFFEVEICDVEPTPEKRMISMELSKKITSSIENLPPRCKMIFKLIREDGLSYKEVGEVLNISVKTVDAQMVIAVKQIAQSLKPHIGYSPRRVRKKQ